MSAALEVEWGRVALVRISNPGRANGVTPALMVDLAALMQRVERDESVDAVVFTGAGEFFCAGADLSDMRGEYEARGIDDFVGYLCNEWMPSVQRAVSAIRSSRAVTVAAVNGPATAGGLDLALSCDYVVAVPDAKLGESYVKLGLVPVAGGVHLLSRRLPSGIARRLLLSGAVVAARELAPFGLPDELVARAELLERARELATEMSAAPAVTRSAYRVAFTQDDDAVYAQHLTHALRANTRILHEPAVQQALVELLQHREATPTR